MEKCKQQSEIEMSHLPGISIYGYVGGRQIYALWALEWACQTFFGSIGINKNNTYQIRFLFWHQNCRSHRFRRLVGV